MDGETEQAEITMARAMAVMQQMLLINDQSFVEQSFVRLSDTCVQRTVTVRREDFENVRNEAINAVIRQQLDSSSSDESDDWFAMFDVEAFQTIKDEEDKKYLIYRVRIKHGSARADLHATEIYRRYTDFLTLYEGLKKELPELKAINFPRKVYFGNFSEKVFTERAKSFYALLELTRLHTPLHESLALLNFLQEKELNVALGYCAEKRYDLAEPLLRYNFRLLNKVYTDRSPAVLISLCRLVGCYAMSPGLNNANNETNAAERWATLALHRFDGVSDVDMLMLYGPLLEACLQMLDPTSKDWQIIKDRLADMKIRGIYNSKKEPRKLLDLVNEVDRKFRKLTD